MRIDVMGVGFDSLTMDEAVARARDLMAERRAAYVVTPNPEIVMLCREDAAAMQAVQNADLVLADGIGVIYGATDPRHTAAREAAWHRLCRGADDADGAARARACFCFGAKPGVADAAGEKLREQVSRSRHRRHERRLFFRTMIPLWKRSMPCSRICCSYASAHRSRSCGCSATPRSLRVGLMAGLGGSLDVFAGNGQARTEVFPEARSRVVLPAHQRAEAHRPHDEIAEIPVCGHRPQAAGEETPWRRVN